MSPGWLGPKTYRQTVGCLGSTPGTGFKDRDGEIKRMPAAPPSVGQGQVLASAEHHQALVLYENRTSGLLEVDPGSQNTNPAVTVRGGPIDLAEPGCRTASSGTAVDRGSERIRGNTYDGVPKPLLVFG